MSILSNNIVKVNVLKPNSLYITIHLQKSGQVFEDMSQMSQSLASKTRNLCSK